MHPAEAILRAWFEGVWNQRSSEIARKYADDETVFHGIDATGGPAMGLSQFLDFQQLILNAIPDIQFRVEQVVSNGDMAAMRWTAEGTHQGSWMGRTRTNKSIRFGGMVFVRIDGGMVKESWDEWDRYGLLRQIDGMD